MMTRNKVIFLFTSYSYLTHLLYGLMELLPHPLRVLLFRFLLRQLGTSPYIDHKNYFRYPSRIAIGDDVAINRGCQFYASMRAREGTITIGNGVVFSPNVKIYAASHDYRALNLSDTAGAVVIEDHAWIGADSIILPGVTIGKGAVIGAGSVVSRSIPAFSVATGNPAKVIKQRELYAS
jgi:acetyltransferase-like isoleucine patch superfamily enzyme